MKVLILTVAFAACMALTAPTHASVLTYDVVLSGLNEVPPNASPGFGDATVTLDDVANTLNVSLNYSDLLGGITAGTINCCAAPTGNGPIIETFANLNFGSNPGSDSESYTGISPTIVSNIEAGLSYINLRTNVFPSGEIRGNITQDTLAAPEPGSMALFSGALCGLALLRRKRK